jgi:hypothetical protein
MFDAIARSTSVTYRTQRRKTSEFYSGPALMSMLLMGEATVQKIAILTKPQRFLKHQTLCYIALVMRETMDIKHQSNNTDRGKPS